LEYYEDHHPWFNALVALIYTFVAKVITGVGDPIRCYLSNILQREAMKASDEFETSLK
jgi:hypothetical protein